MNYKEWNEQKMSFISFLKKYGITMREWKATDHYNGRYSDADEASFNRCFEGLLKTKQFKKDFNDLLEKP